MPNNKETKVFRSDVWSFFNLVFVIVIEIEVNVYRLRNV